VAARYARRAPQYPFAASRYLRWSTAHAGRGLSRRDEHISLVTHHLSLPRADRSTARPASKCCSTSSRRPVATVPSASTRSPDDCRRVTRARKARDGKVAAWYRRSMSCARTVLISRLLAAPTR
jgi:hypothetical protein